jgi:hypothetical protein
MPVVGKVCTYKDAEVLARYEGLRPDPTREKNPHNKFIAGAIAARSSEDAACATVSGNDSVVAFLADWHRRVSSTPCGEP